MTSLNRDLEGLKRWIGNKNNAIQIFKFFQIKVQINDVLNCIATIELWLCHSLVRSDYYWAIV